MAAQHLNQYSHGVIGGYQLQARSSAQDFGRFLKTLKAAGQGTKTLWARLVQEVYYKFVLAGNFCSLGIVPWVLRQLGYNETQIIKSPQRTSLQVGPSHYLKSLLLW